MRLEGGQAVDVAEAAAVPGQVLGPQLVNRLEVAAIDHLVEEPAHDADRVAGADLGGPGPVSGRHRQRPGRGWR